MSQCSKWVSGSCGLSGRVAEQNLSYEILANKLQLFWHSPNLQKQFQNVEALVQKYNLVNIMLSKVMNWPSLCVYGLVVQGNLPPKDSQHVAASWRHWRGSLHLPIKFRFKYQQRLSRITCLHRNIQWLNRWLCGCTAFTDSKLKIIRCQSSNLKYNVHYMLGYMRLSGLFGAPEASLGWNYTSIMSGSLSKLASYKPQNLILG